MVWWSLVGVLIVADIIFIFYQLYQADKEEQARRWASRYPLTHVRVITGPPVKSPTMPLTPRFGKPAAVLAATASPASASFTEKCTSPTNPGAGSVSRCSAHE